MNDTATSTTNVATVEAGIREKLTVFQARYPLRSKDVEGHSWVFRRTPGKSAEQRPVIMLPSIQGGGDIFFETVLALGEAVPIITVNAPDIEDAIEMVSGMTEFFKRLDIPCANIVGSSLGAYLAQSFALHFPKMVDQLVVANGFIDVAPFLEQSPPASSFRELDAAVLVQKNIDRLLEAPSDDDGQVRLKAVVKELVGPIQTLENYKSRLLLRMEAPPLEAPPIAPDRVMVVDDDLDPMLPPAMRDPVRKRFAQSEQHAIDGGGHLPTIQRPTIFADLLRRRFIRDVF
jgi:maspardin